MTRVIRKHLANDGFRPNTIEAALRILKTRQVIFIDLKSTRPIDKALQRIPQAFFEGGRTRIAA